MTNKANIDQFKLIEDLKSTLAKCQYENSCILKILSTSRLSETNRLLSIQPQFFNACSDIPESNKISGRTNSHAKLSRKEHICQRIKHLSEQNAQLRESNVKLKQESKLQDQKIRDLYRQMVVQKRNIHQNECQKAIIKNLKSILDKKEGEIKLLKRNLERVKPLNGIIPNTRKSSTKVQKKPVSATNLKTEVEPLGLRITKSYIGIQVPEVIPSEDLTVENFNAFRHKNLDFPLTNSSFVFTTSLNNRRFRSRSV